MSVRWENVAYYRTVEGYERNDDRLEEPRFRWAAQCCGKGVTVVDVGANDGVLAQLLDESCTYWGVELNPVAMRNACPQAVGRLLMGVAEFLPFTDSSVDVVVIMEVLEHLVDPSAFFAEAARVLKPDGRLVTTSAAGPTCKWKPGNKEHLREWNPPEFRDLHVGAGFVVMSQGLAEVYAGRFTNCILARKARGA